MRLAHNLLEDLINTTNPTLQSLPRYRQIYQQIRQAILDGRIAADCLLPPSRHLATQLSVSRNTVISAYEQLQAEGLITSQTGSGTRVTYKASNPTTNPYQTSRKDLTAQRIKTLPGSPPAHFRLPTGCFLPGVPDMAEFPYKSWNRILNRSCQQTNLSLSNLDLAAGVTSLRMALAQYLNISRGLNVGYQQIFITAGANQSLQLITRTLTNPGDTAWIEEPGYGVAKMALQLADLKLHPAPVDHHGLSTAASSEGCDSPKLIYTTASHQYPLGYTLTSTRRLELIEYAQQHNSWIIEDDYDGEFHYKGEPMPALAGLNNNQCTLYMGTFSKILSPHLRMSYLVVPDVLIDSFRKVYPMLGNESSVATQTAMAEFIRRGYFTTHIKKMRQLYAQRRELLLSELHEFKRIDEINNRGGLHIPLKVDTSDNKLIELLASKNLACQPLSHHYHWPDKQNALLLGFTSAGEEELLKGIKILKRVLDQQLK